MSLANNLIEYVKKIKIKKERKIMRNFIGNVVEEVKENVIAYGILAEVVCNIVAYAVIAGVLEGSLAAISLAVVIGFIYNFGFALIIAPEVCARKDDESDYIVLVRYAIYSNVLALLIVGISFL